MNLETLGQGPLVSKFISPSALKDICKKLLQSKNFSANITGHLSQKTIILFITR